MTRSRARFTAVALLGVMAIVAAIAALPSPLWSRPVATDAPGASQVATASPAGTVSPTPTVLPTPVPTPELSILDQAGIRDRLQGAVDKGRATLAAPAIVASVLFADGSSWSGTSGVAALAYTAWAYWVFRARLGVGDIPVHAGLKPSAP